MEREYSREIAENIKTFLDNDDWHYSFMEDKGVFRFGLNIKSRLKSVQYAIIIKEDNYLVYAVASVSADPEDTDQMLRMAEFICRANYGLRNGNFELDFRDGEIRYKCYVDCSMTPPTEEMIRTSIHCPAAMFRCYGNSIAQLIFTDITAEEAIANSERAMRESAEEEAPSPDPGSERSSVDPGKLLDLLQAMQRASGGEGSDGGSDDDDDEF